MDDLHHALLRISMAQILKASGFDKCKPSTLNTITDLYIQFLKLLLQNCLKYQHQRHGTRMDIRDITRAMLDVGLLKPNSFEGWLDVSDVPRYAYVQDPGSNLHKNYHPKSAQSFRDWVIYSDQFRVSRQLAEVPRELAHNLLERRKLDTSTESEQERKRRRLRERQEYYNHFNMHEDINDDDVADAMDVNVSWLEYLAEKDLKFGHDETYANTVLERHVRSGGSDPRHSNYLVAHDDVEVPEHVQACLPYNRERIELYGDSDRSQ
ncbi:Transcription initiation factor TFIID subunit 3 [Meyerozyma sp. JA9]|nr:Transcription initiation factor TFIID subunit 3 [Meyerozyma sp. JA9]